MRKLLALLILWPVLSWANYDSVVSADNPQYWWHLDDTTGTVATDSGNNTHIDGTYTGGFTLNQTGIPGNTPHPAVAFNGSTGYVVTAADAAFGVPGNPTPSGYSVEAWVKPTTTATQTAVALGTTTPKYWWEFILRTTTNDFQVRVFTNDNSCNANGVYGEAHGGSFSAGNWYQMVFTIAESSNVYSHLILYVNGSSVQDQTSFTGTVCNTATHAITIGRRDDNAQYLNGVEDEVSMYITSGSLAGQLTPTQVLTHYNAGNTAPATFWPYTVKRPELPQFRNDGYWARFVNYGYNTGLFSPKILRPQFFESGFSQLRSDAKWKLLR